MFKLRFKKADVQKLAGCYAYADDSIVEEEIGPSAKKRGYFRRKELLDLCYWKTPRSQSKVEQNSSSLIKEITGIALSTSHERLRIGVLQLLHGISMPTASVILHFAHKDRYPIIDYRALWSLGLQKPRAMYTFEFWSEYVEFCRDLAEKNGSVTAIDDVRTEHGSLQSHKPPASRESA